MKKSNWRIGVFSSVFLVVHTAWPTVEMKPDSNQHKFVLILFSLLQAEYVNVLKSLLLVVAADCKLSFLHLCWE